MKICLSLLCFFLFFSAAIHAKTDDHPTDGPELLLGDGYLTYDHMSVGGSAIKMEGTRIFYSGVQSSVLLDQTSELSELAKNLNIDLSASGGWGDFSGTGAANYLHHVENDQFSENFSYSERFFAYAVLDFSALPPNINALSKNAQNMYNNDGIQAFTNYYGDTFIRQLPVGAYLIVNVRLSFSSAMDKESFDTALNGKFGSIFGAGAQIKNAVDKSNARGTIEVSAYQLGGDPNELPNIFAQRADGGYYLTLCSLSDVKSCQMVIDGVIRYAQTNFCNQIKDSHGGPPLGKLVVVGAPLLATYAHMFNLQPAPPLDSHIIMKRLEMAKVFKTIKSQNKFINHFVASPASRYFTPPADILIHDLKSNIQWNVSLFEQFNAINCYEPGSEISCAGIFEKINEYTKPIDKDALDYYMNNGYQEIKTGCIYVPVGLHNQQFQNYAYDCDGTWVKGSFVFNMSNDRNTLSLKSDWNAANNHHLTFRVDMTPDETLQNYSGRGVVHDLTLGLWYFKTMAVRLTRNKV